MSIKGVLFDKDGVLVDFDATWCPAAVQVIETLAAGDQEKYKALAEAADFDLDAKKFRKDAVFIAGTATDLVNGFGAEHVTSYDDVADTLTALGNARIAMGIATNDEEISARTQMRALRLDGRFSFVSGADTGHGAKPEPGMLLAFAEHIGAEPGEIVMVGDSTHDMRAARAAGMIGVAVGTGPASLEDLEPFADHCLPRLAGLPALASSL